ncbi:hypothetical protein M218_00655 [Burkholderia pseudomallei MSHR338]|nr:hypothetical protein M218_00655 [Burkholderia pseudomallei MSHR338]
MSASFAISSSESRAPRNRPNGQVAARRARA